jgi:hypothetical protein
MGLLLAAIKVGGRKAIYHATSADMQFAPKKANDEQESFASDLFKIVRECGAANP